MASEQIPPEGRGKAGLLGGFVALLLLFLTAEIVLAVSNGVNDLVKLDRSLHDPVMRSPGMIWLAVLVFIVGYVVGCAINARRRKTNLTT